MVDWSNPVLAVFFGSKRIGTFDRLGSAKYNQNNAAQSFYPYGEDRGTVEPNDSLKFATYTRDAATGLDYADQRYYANNFGRMTSPDPYEASAGPKDPKSWNRYSYTRGDPVNRYDPAGLDDCDPDDPCEPPPPPDPCAPTPEGRLAPGASSSPCDPQPVRPPDQLPQGCEIELWQRPAGFSGDPGKHTYILFDDPNLPAAQQIQIIQGDPNQSRLLTGFVTPPGGGPGSGTSHASDPLAKNNKEIGRPYLGANVCELITEMLNAVKTYNNGARVPYKFNPNGTTNWNSNSFTFTLLAWVGIDGYFGVSNPVTVQGIPLPYPGWGMTVPGLYP
jgi:RHS repeat-associated protein